MDTKGLLCAAGLILGALAVSPTASAQPQNLIATDRLEATMIATGREEAIPLVEERLTVAIDGQHATTTLLQVFQHGNGAQIEGRYKLRPGLGSRVEGFSYWNGEQKILGEVFERTTARQVYDNVTTRRRDPGLLEEDGEGAFQFKVFPIQPQEKKRVELRWSKFLERHGQTVRYRAPITRGDAEVVIDVQGAVKNIRSSTHKLRIDRDSNGVRLRSDGMRGRGELVVEWDVDEPEWLPSAYVHRGGETDGYFALSLATADVNTGAIAPKDVTIVIDRSGSMTGEPLANAKAAAVDVIRRLSPADRVNIVAFSDEVDSMWRVPMILDEENRGRAVGYVQRLHEGGGTDIALALTTAIKSQDVKPGRPRVVVFMTDGQSDVDKSVLAAQADTGDIRLFTVGLGKEVNRPLLQRLAQTKRGNFTYIEKPSAIQADMAKLATHIAKPLLVDVSIDVDGVQAMRIYPRSLPDLFVDDQLVVSGRLKGNTGVAKFTIKGRLAGKPVTFIKSVDLSKAPPRPWVGRQWAAKRVEHLQEEIALGAKQPELMTELLELALAYNFVTPYTAFLAIPESELGDQRGTIEAARAAKKKIMANNPDAANLEKNAPGGTYITADRTQNLPAPPSPGRSFSASADSESMDIDEDAPTNKRSAGEYATVQTSKGRGCAGCATGADASSTVLLLGLVALMLRRRRR